MGEGSRAQRLAGAMRRAIGLLARLDRVLGGMYTRTGAPLFTTSAGCVP
jgi:hypothetical protein